METTLAAATPFGMARPRACCHTLCLSHILESFRLITASELAAKCRLSHEVCGLRLCLKATRLMWMIYGHLAMHDGPEASTLPDY